LYYEVCNEAYFGGVAMDWQYRIVDTIVDAEKSFPHQHLISMNIGNGRKKVEQAHPGVSILNFHYCVPPDAVALNYGLNRVIGENETGFRGPENANYRPEGWDFMLAGGALYNNLDYSFTRSNPTGTCLSYTSPGGGNPTLRKELKILDDFINSFTFLRMQPHDEIIRKVTTSGLSARALAELGQQYAIYVHAHHKKGAKLRTGISTQLVLDLPAGSYVAECVNTKTGASIPLGKFNHLGGQRTLTLPVFDVDIALRIMRATTK